MNRKEEISELINYQAGKTLDDYNEAQWINTDEFVDRWGRLRNRVYGNTKIVKNIINKPIKHWGCISDYNISTQPSSFIRLKGMEVTTINNDDKSIRGKDLINRRYLSLLLRDWCYIFGIKYLDRSNNNKNGIDLWGIKLNNGIDYLNGEMAINMIKDILLFVRNKNKKSIWNNASEQLISIIMSKTSGKKAIKMETYINQVKDRLYYEYNKYEHIWNYPKWHIEYLNSQILLLNSSDYLTDILVPLIYDTYLYPIKCTSVRAIKDDSEFESKKDDYDLTQYTQERN